jgi:uncharacterized protein YukE
MGREIRVQTPELGVAATAITSVAGELGEAQGAVRSAQGQAGSFGGGPVAAAFSNVCSQAARAAGEYESTATQLADNVAAAALGYVNTDEGVIPVKLLGPEGRNP